MIDFYFEGGSGEIFHVFKFVFIYCVVPLIKVYDDVTNESYYAVLSGSVAEVLHTIVIK